METERTPADERLAFALLDWYLKTHGDRFGHDHHCPVREDDDARPDCTCNWTLVLDAERAMGDGE